TYPHPRVVPQRHASRIGACMTTTMKAAQISKPSGDWELVERVIPEPHAGHVRVKVEACGICHSDVFVKEGVWPGLEYPRVPGHEIAGHIDAVGDNVSTWRQGQRVGVGWHGGHCFVCAQCRRGDFAMCVQRKVTGFDFDGGYAEYMLARAETLAALPEALPAEEAGPFMCAGVTSTTRCAMLGRAPGRSSTCTASAGSAISACSTRARWALRRSRSTGATTKSRWRGNWGRIITSMRALTMR